MNKFLKITLAFVLAIVVVAGGVVGYAIYQGTKRDHDSKEAAQAVAEEFTKDWSKEALVKRAGSQMRVQLNSEQADKYISGFKETFGKLIKLEEFKGSSVTNVDPKKGIINFAN